MKSTIEIVTTQPERRQLARALQFSSQTAPHINWDSIATTARELGAHFEARFHDDGRVGVTMFWSYRDDEV